MVPVLIINSSLCFIFKNNFKWVIKLKQLLFNNIYSWQNILNQQQYFDTFEWKNRSPFVLETTNKLLDNFPVGNGTKELRQRQKARWIRDSSVVLNFGGGSHEL